MFLKIKKKKGPKQKPKNYFRFSFKAMQTLKKRKKEKIEKKKRKKKERKEKSCGPIDNWYTITWIDQDLFIYFWRREFKIRDGHLGLRKFKLGLVLDKTVSSELHLEPTKQRMLWDQQIWAIATLPAILDFILLINSNKIFGFYGFMRLEFVFATGKSGRVNFHQTNREVTCVAKRKSVIRQSGVVDEFSEMGFEGKKKP